MATAPRKTIADRKAQVQQPSFSIKVTGDLAGHKAGDTLTLVPHIGGYFRAMLSEAEGIETSMTDQQIVDIVKGVNIEGLDPESAEIARVEALQTAVGQTQGDYDAGGEVVG